MSDGARELDLLWLGFNIRYVLFVVVSIRCNYLISQHLALREQASAIFADGPPGNWALEPSADEVPYRLHMRCFIRLQIKLSFTH